METNTAPVTETSTPVAVETPVVETPKGKPGRPAFELKYPRGIFGVDELYELNRGPRGKGKKAKVCKLTIRNHIEKELETGFLTQVESLKTGKPGQPAKQYIRTAVKAGLEAARATREGGTPTETPVVEVSLVEAPAPVTAEAPADMVAAN